MSMELKINFFVKYGGNYYEFTGFSRNYEPKRFF